MRRSIKQLLSAVLVVAMIASLLVVPAAATGNADADVAAGVYQFCPQGHAGATGSALSGASDLPDGVSFTGVSDWTGNGHGPHGGANGTMVVNVPANKYSTLVFSLCQYSKLDGAITSDKGTVTVAAADGSSGDSGKIVTVTNATGKTTITFEKEFYIHGLTVGEFSDGAVTQPPAVSAPEKVTDAKVGRTTTIAVSIANADGKEVSWDYTVDDDTILTGITSADEGEVSFTAAKVGKATLTVTATVDGTDYSKDVTVFVRPAQIVELQPGTISFVPDATGEATYYTTDMIEWPASSVKWNGDGHGVELQADAKVTVPDGKTYKLVITTCQYNSDDGAISVDGAEVTKGTETDPVFTISGVTGAATLKVTGKVYIHSIKVEDVAAPKLTLGKTAVVLKGTASEDVTAKAENYAEDMKLFAVSADEAVATATAADDGSKVTVTGVAVGETKVYVGMAKETPANAEAAKDVEGVQEIKVNVMEEVTGPVTSWDFSAPDFTDDKYAVATPAEYNGLVFSANNTASKETGGTSKPHVVLKASGTITVPVSGPCGVAVTTYYCGGTSYKVGEETVLLPAGNDEVTTSCYYTGTEKTVDIAHVSGNQVYIKKIELFPTTWDFSAADFQTVTNTDTAYNGLTLNNVKSHGGKYAHLGTNGKVSVPVPGKCNVTVNCEYGNHGTVGDMALEGDNDAGIDTTVYHYDGEAGVVEIARTDGDVYLTSISLSAYTDPSAQLKLSAEKAELELGGQAVEITAEVVGGTATGDMTVAVPEADKDIVTAAVAEGKITLTPGTKAGKTTVTVSVPAKNTKDEPNTATAEIAVTVIDPNVMPTAWDLRVASAADLPSAMRGLVSEKGTSSKPASYHGATYGVYFYTGNKIGIPVDGPSTITVTGGYEWHFGMGTALSADVYGTVDGKEGQDEAGNTFKVKDETFTYTGGKGYAWLTSMGPNTSYVAAIKVEPLTGVTPNAVDVWDFSAEALDTSLFTNKLTVDIMNAWYPADVTVGSTGVNFPKEGFNTGELSFQTGADEATQTANNRLRTDNEAITRHSSQTKLGAVGADPYASNEITVDAETGEVKGGEFYHGLIYSNGTGNQNINMTLQAKAGDKITYISSSNGGAAQYAFKDAEGNILGTGDYAPEGSINAVPLTFYAPADGAYTYAINNQEKLVVCRIYREAGVKTTVTGNVDQTLAAGLTGEYSVVFTGPGGVETKAPVKDGKYTIELNNYLTGADYVVSLEGADGFIVASGEEFSLERTDRTGSHDIIVASVDLVTVTGKVAGLGEADLANVKLVITKPEDKIYQPKIVPAADGSFTASFEKGVEYAVEALNVKDYELVKDKLTFTADKTENVIFVPKTTYTVTMAPDPATVDLSAATITFTNKDDVDEAHEGGYVYTFTGADGIKLRDGQYVVEVKGASGIQKLTPDLVVAGSDTECPVPFLVETPTLWDFADATWSSQSGEIPAYNGLVMSGVMVNKTYALGNAGASIQIPVDGACTVTVSYCYKANGTVGDVAFSTDSGSTGTIESASYKYTGGKGTVELKYVDQSYLTKIEVIKSTPYAETVTVGADKQYKTINEALAAVKTMERTAEQRVTILIDPGDYEEMLRIDTPNVTLKNASATPSIELKNKGVDIDANAVRITSYYGHGYAYYSMDKDCTYNEELLAVNKANGRLSFENPGTGTTSGSYWNATVRIMASGIQAEGIIFENSFNQYVSKKAAEDVIVPLQGAKEGAVPRAEMKAGDTTVQHKEYVERAAALAINNNCAEIFFDNCRFVGRQDTLYGGVNSTVGFYNCAVMGGTDYIFGGMNAVFAKCDLIFNTNDETEKGQKDDVGYITAPQQTSGRGYLMYNCHVTSTTPGVDTASNFVSKPGTFGRPWAANTGEAVFYATDIDSTDPVYYTGDTAKGTSMIQGIGWFDTLSGKSALCGDFGTVEYYEGADTTADRASWAAKLTEAKTADGADLNDTKAWLGGWDAFAGKDMTIANQTPKPFSAEVLKEELVAAITAAQGVYDVAPDAVADDVTAADVDRGEKFVNASAKEALKDAIAAAQAVMNKTDATVGEVLAAQKALATAVKTFNNAVKDGAKAPDTTALKAALDAAATAKAGVVITSGPADKVVKDVAFAPKTAFDALNNAIREAEKVLDGAASTQKDVADATKALTDAIAAFNAAKGVGTKAADAASLKAAIEAATAAKEGVVVNAGPADQVDSGVKFVTDKAVIDALDKAIAAAQAVADKANATQAELDAALKALTIAKADFDASVQTGTKGGVEPGKPDTAALSAAIDAAKGVYAIGDDVKVMPAGTKASDVTRGQKFVTQDAVDALAKAIADAEAVLAKEGATQEEIDAAVAALNAAVETFQKAIKTGTKGSFSGGGGSSSSSSSATTTTKQNANGQTVKKTTNRNGDVVYTVTDKNGEVIAKVELPASIPATTKKFKDVPENHWAEKSINDLAARGMVNGVADEIYDMASPVTRGSVATILFRLAQAKGVAADFSDVAEGAWYAEAVGWAAKYGVVNGFEDGTFKADSSITREQLAVMLYRFANLLAVDTKATGSLSSFADAEGVSDWAKDAMTWAVGAGIIKGNDAKELNATDAATRAETACMVDRFIALLK